MPKAAPSNSILRGTIFKGALLLYGVFLVGFLIYTIAPLLSRSDSSSELIHSVQNGAILQIPLSNETPQQIIVSNAPLIRSLQKNFTEAVKHIFENVDAVVLMDHPEYPNRGDSALYTGEVAFLNSLNIPIIYECNVQGLRPCNITYVKQILDPKTGLVCFSGGGSFGDIWGHLREARERWLSALHEYRVFQFPQTVHFKNMKTANYSSKVWAAHPNVTITVRDVASVVFLRQYFPTSTVLLVPDAAFLMGPKKRFAPEFDIFWLMREDKETSYAMTPAERKQKILAMKPEGLDITMHVADWLGHDASYLPQRGELLLTRRAYKRTLDALKFLSRGKVLVSDRLHSHILSTLLDVPHVLLDNENGKVFNVHNTWTSPAVKIRLAKDLDEALEKALELLEEYNEAEEEEEGHA